MDYTAINIKLQSIINQFDFNNVKGGCSLTIFHQGKLVSNLNFGETNIADQMAWDNHTLSLNYSTGKGVLATLIHILVSKKLLQYDIPICQYWTDFAQNGKQNITLREVLSHEAGLFDITSVTDNASDVQDWHTMLEKVAKMAISPKKIAINQNDEKFVAYSALVSGWVLGGLIEEVTDLTLQQALDQYLCEPLGIVGQVYFKIDLDKINQIAVPERVVNLSTRTKPVLTADKAEVLAFYQSLDCYPTWQKLANKDDKALTTQDINQLYFNIRKIDMADYKASLVPKQSREFDYYQPQTLKSQIPAANVVATGFAMAKIYAMLANGGELDGSVLIDKATFEALQIIQNQQFDRVMPAMMYWRLGYHRVFSVCHDVESAFGHTGYNGSMAWCDPSKNLSIAFVHNYDVTMLTDIRQFIINETVLDLFKK